MHTYCIASHRWGNSTHSFLSKHKRAMWWAATGNVWCWALASLKELSINIYDSHSLKYSWRRALVRFIVCALNSKSELYIAFGDSRSLTWKSHIIFPALSSRLSLYSHVCKYVIWHGKSLHLPPFCSTREMLCVFMNLRMCLSIFMSIYVKH